MYLLVFPDGETFNTLPGCTIQEVPDGLDIEEVEHLLREEEGILVAELTDSAEFVGKVKQAASES